MSRRIDRVHGGLKLRVPALSRIYPVELPQLRQFLGRVRRDARSSTIALTCRTKDRTFLTTEMSLHMFGSAAARTSSGSCWTAASTANAILATESLRRCGTAERGDGRLPPRDQGRRHPGDCSTVLRWRQCGGVRPAFASSWPAWAVMAALVKRDCASTIASRLLRAPREMRRGLGAVGARARAGECVPCPE
jgi:hypothetical protein